MEIGTWGEWVSGVGALAAALVALKVARDARHIAGETRAAMVRDRTAQQLVELIQAVEADIAESRSPETMSITRSPEATGLCRSLWRYRNQFGTVWHVYCEPDQRWPADLLNSGELYPRMRGELQDTLASLNREDSIAAAPRPKLRQRTRS
jgi:hypothetical protein